MRTSAHPVERLATACKRALARSTCAVWLLATGLGCGGRSGQDAGTEWKGDAEPRAASPGPSPLGSGAASTVGRGPRCRPEGEAFEVGRSDTVDDLAVVQLGTRAVFVWLEASGIKVISMGEGRVAELRRLDDHAGREEAVVTTAARGGLFLVHGFGASGEPPPKDPCGVKARWLERTGREIASAMLPLSRCPQPRGSTHVAVASEDELWVLGTGLDAREIRLVSWRPPSAPTIAARFATGTHGFVRRLALAPTGLAAVWGFGAVQPRRHQAARWADGRSVVEELPAGIEFDLALQDGEVVEWGPKRPDRGPAHRRLAGDLAWQPAPGPAGADAVRLIDGVDQAMALVTTRTDPDTTYLVDAEGSARLPFTMTTGDVATDAEHGTLTWVMRGVVQAQPLRCDPAPAKR